MTRSLFLALILVFAQSSTPVFATGESSPTQDPTKEERQTWAERHEKMAGVQKKMAECLRSEKPLSECREEMKEECPMAKDGNCPMMEGMKGMGMGKNKGKGRGKRMMKSDDNGKED